MKGCSSKVNDKNSLKKTTEEMLDKLIAPNTSTGLGCDNMSTVIVDIRNLFSWSYWFLDNFKV